VPEFVGLPAQPPVALVAPDPPKSLRFPVTADLLYLRRRGAEGLYVSGYDESALDHWAPRIARWAAGGGWRPGTAVFHRATVYTCLDNDAEVWAPAGARARPPPGRQRPCRSRCRSRRRSLQINRYLAPRRISRFQYDAITTIFGAWNLDPTASW
jgi:hypothetical protein